ncbi:MAG: hypothetical protein DRI69_11120 [Bacteroidetes bacterium]|nr:MAG: hypothetical protein DRI69_11120 [Bacteroidota bacterium]
MTINMMITRFVDVTNLVYVPKTLKAASAEAADYEWMRVNDNAHICKHGNKTYPLLLKETEGKLEIACGCEAWQYAHDNDGCKHVAAFLKLSNPPQKPIPEEIARELMAAGWTGGRGNLHPPEGTSDPDGEDNEGSDPTPVDPPKREPVPSPGGGGAIKRIIEEAEGLGAIEVDAAYVDEKLAKLRMFKVVGSEAERSVVSGILRAQGIKRPKGQGGRTTNQLLTVDRIDAADVWCNIRVKVTQLWDSDKDSIRQIGLVGDETGVMKFVSWEKADLQMIEADKCYSIENVVTNEYDGRFSVAFTKNTKIAGIEEDIVVGFTTSEYSGHMVQIQNGSGLIKRCAICNRAMQHGTCKEHGTAKNIQDLRIKAVLDNGVTTKNILLNRERTEALTGITMDAAIAMAREALDAGVVSEQIEAMLLMKEYEVSGQDMGDTILVESISEVNAAVTKEEIEALLKEV